MFAVIKTGGKQYRVEENNIIKIEKLESTEGETIVFDHVLMIGDATKSTVGAPLIVGAKVEALILKQMRDRKVIIFKKKLNEEQFVTFEEVVELLKICGLTCHYCSEHVFILYEKVRETKQWSLDRINNDIGHNNKNLVIACLECNLKRRRTNKDAFMFTKNMVIIKEGK